MNEARKRELVETDNVTLDGHKARIAGVKLAFPVVRTLDDSGIEATFSWEAVENVVMNKGGAFSTGVNWKQVKSSSKGRGKR